MSTQPDPDSLRIGTAEREEACRLLGEHFAEGRLNTQEYESRVSCALAAENRAALRPLFADLPAPQPAFLRPPMPGYGEPYAPPATYAPWRPAPAGPPPARFDGGPSDKSKVTAGVLQLLLPFGIGRFYTGHTGIAIAQLLLAPCGVGVVWSMVDGVVLLVSGGNDAYGRQLLD
jgi:TM2 domain-containing membrane protein YozV